MKADTAGRDAASGGRRPTPRVVVAGDLTVDDVVLADGTTHMASIGGDCLYAALGARLWEPSVGVVTRRGEDFPRELLGSLEALGICLDGVVDIAGPTVRNWVIYEADGRRHWVYRTPPGRSREVAVRPDDVPGHWLDARPAPVVHVAAMPIDAAERVVDAVRRAAPNAIITLDTHEDYVAGYRDQLVRTAGRVDAFLPSREELAELVGYDDPPRALHELSRETAVPLVVVKMGRDGVLVWQKARASVVIVGAAQAQVVDVTGAGDAFCGGFAAGIARGLDAVEAARRGAISAAFTVEGFSSLALVAVGPAHATARLNDSPPPVETGPVVQPGRQGAARGSLRPVATTDPFAIELMGEEIGKAAPVLASHLAAMHAPLRGLAQTLAGTGVPNLYLVGCGDSHLAGAAAELAFARNAGVPAEAVHALDMARYRVRYLPRGSAVLCLSYSGEVGRTIEAAAQARAFGHRVIALTGNGHSRLAAEATDVLSMTVPTLGSTPGTITFLTMLAALYELGLEWGAALGLRVDGARTALERVPELAAQTLDRCEEPAGRLADRLRDRAAITLIGAGPNEATARFGAAKLFEGPQMRGAATNLEEWAHGEYFISRDRQPVVVVAPAGATSDRAAEILAELAFIGADVTLISDGPPPVEVRTAIELAPGLPEEFSPLLAALPLSLLAFYLARARGKRSYNFPNPEAAREHYDTIHRDTRGRPA